MALFGKTNITRLFFVGYNVLMMGQFLKTATDTGEMVKVHLLVHNVNLSFSPCILHVYMFTCILHDEPKNEIAPFFLHPLSSRFLKIVPSSRHYPEQKTSQGYWFLNKVPK